ncbi:MAG: glycosyltransferase [Sulfurimonadaceae bacterium]|nr:glycosyltransferase [Candidatus Cloacimonadota bacterium]
MKKFNILQLVTGLGVGGAERVILDLSRSLDKEIFNNYVVSMSCRKELLGEFHINGINTVVLDKTNSVKDFILLIKYLNTFVKKKHIDIIHAHLPHALIVGSFVKLFNPRVKIVFTSHSLNIESKFREIIIYLLKPLRNRDIVFSKDIVKFFYKKNFTIIPNGIDIEKYHIQKEKFPIFTYIAVGRLESMKNHKLLIEIANKLKKENYLFQILIVGEGELRLELEELITKYGLVGIVKLLGLRNDIANLLNQSHCFLMPSIYEGLPISMLEAGASSLPVITTPVGSIPSLVNNKNGYLCLEKEFEMAMKKVYEDYSTAKKKGDILYNKVRELYSLSSVVREHEKLYLELSKV